MNYNCINRNSLMNSLYTDRPHHHLQNSEVWTESSTQPHLNPSKSKVNIRHSLNKTMDPTNTSFNSYNIRNSCVVNQTSQPLTAQSQYKQDQPQEGKYFKAAKENNDFSFQTFKRQNICPKTQAMPPTAHPPEFRKKSQSFRTSSYNQLLPKWKDIKGFEPFDPHKARSKEPLEHSETEELKNKLEALEERVKANEEELSKIKEKEEKNNHLASIEKDLNKFKNQLFDIYQFNSKHFSQFEEKIQKQQQQLSSVQEQLSEIEQGEYSKKIMLLGTRINELFEGFKHKDSKHTCEMQEKLYLLQSNLKGVWSEQIDNVKKKLEEQCKKYTFVESQISKINERSEKHLSEYKRSTKICRKPITIQSKETISLKENELFKDRTNQNINNENIPLRDFDMVSSKQKSLQSKEEILMRHKIYHVDTEGFLLDDNKFYLVDSNNQQIKVPQAMLMVLKHHNLLSLK